MLQARQGLLAAQCGGHRRREGHGFAHGRGLPLTLSFGVLLCDFALGCHLLSQLPSSRGWCAQNLGLHILPPQPSNKENQTAVWKARPKWGLKPHHRGGTSDRRPGTGALPFLTCVLRPGLPAPQALIMTHVMSASGIVRQSLAHKPIFWNAVNFELSPALLWPKSRERHALTREAVMPFTAFPALSRSGFVTVLMRSQVSHRKFGESRILQAFAI